MTVTVGSLFSGIGGLDLGLERAGMTVRWQAEIDPYCCRVLERHWPGIPNLGDVTTVDWTTVEPVDVICGGYPCQPFSTAGKRLGADDPRHLWPYVRECLRVLRPRYAVLENVPGHLTLGFADVLADLAALGFDAEWDVVAAAEMGAPHRRRRLFVLAYPAGVVRTNQPEGVDGEAMVGSVAGTGGRTEHGHPASRVQVDGRAATRGAPLLAYADGTGLPHGRGHRPGGRAEPRGGERWWAVEPDVGRVAHGVPARVDRLRALGNAVVPQVAEFIGRRVMEMAA